MRASRAPAWASTPADYDGSGRPSLVIGNFTNEMMALYSNEGNGLFIDEAPASTIGRASLLRLTFACFFFDVDLDGLLDIFAANGHVADDIAKVQPTITHAQPPLLFRNSRREEVRGRDRHARRGVRDSRWSARGAAYGDYDNDGDLDLLVTANNGPARLLRNDGGTNRDAAGRARRARRRIATRSGRASASMRDGGPTPWRMVKTGIELSVAERAAR